MAAKHVIAVTAGAVVGITYIAIRSIKGGALGGLDLALPQALAAITLVFNIALLIDLLRFQPAQFGDLIHSRNTLIGGTFMICFLAPYYMITAFIALIGQ